MFVDRLPTLLAASGAAFGLLVYGLTRAASIGTEAPSALTMHLSKIAAYGAGDLLTTRVLVRRGIDAGHVCRAWVGRRIVGRISDRVFVVPVETGLVAAGVLFLIGLRHLSAVGA